MMLTTANLPSLSHEAKNERLLIITKEKNNNEESQTVDRT